MDHDARRANHRMTIAIAASVALHAVLGLAWFTSHLANARAHQQDHDLTALSDAITISVRTVPRIPTAQPRRVAAQPSRPAVPAPAPKPPRVVPTPRPVAVVHVKPPAMRARHRKIVPTPVAAVTPAPTPAPRTGARPQPRHPKQTALGSDQLAAMQRAFEREIAASRPVPSSVATPPPAAASTRVRRDLVMAGTRDDVLGGQGVCVSLRDWIDGQTRRHYIECRTVYADGYEETVAFPWPMSWPVDADPIDHPGEVFHPQPPPADFALPAAFTPSRAVCTFFRARCAQLFDAQGPPGPA